VNFYIILILKYRHNVQYSAAVNSKKRLGEEVCTFFFSLFCPDPTLHIVRKLAFNKLFLAQKLLYLGTVYFYVFNTGSSLHEVEAGREAGATNTVIFYTLQSFNYQ
jgi:hypothetical protein